MPTEELRVEIRLRDFVTRQLRRMQGSIQKFATFTANKFRSLGRAVLSLRGAFVALGAGILAKSFIAAGSAMEKFRIQIEAVLDQNKALAQQTIGWLRDFAAATPFTTKAVIESFVTLRAAGVRVTKDMLKTVGNVAFVFDRNISDLSVALVGMEKEVFKRLGIGWEIVGKRATITLGDMAVETDKSIGSMRKAILGLWAEKFPDSMKEAEKTWSGLIALFKSQIFEFQADVVEAGVFDFLKEGIKVASQEFGEFAKKPDEVANAIIDGMEIVVKSLAAVADGIQVLKIIFVALGIAVNGVMVVISGAITGMLRKVEDVLKSVSNSISVIQSFGSTFLIQAFGPGFAGALGSAKKKVDDLAKGVKSFGDAGVVVMKEYVDSVKISVEEVKRLTEASKFEEAVRIFDKIKAGLKVREDLKLLTNEFVRLREAQFKALSGMRFGEIARIQIEMNRLQEEFAKHGERGAEALALAKQQAMLLKTETKEAAKAAKRMEKPTAEVAANMEKAAAAAAAQKAATAESAEAIKKFEEMQAEQKLDRIKQRFDEIKSAAVAVGNVIGNNIMRGIDDAIEGTFRWKKALQGVAQDLGKLLLRMAIQAGIQFAAGAVSGALAGGGASIPAAPVIPPAPAGAKGMAVFGGMGVPSFQGGGIVRGTTLAQIGDNRSKVEGVFPLARGRFGEMGVQAVGAQQAPMQITFNVTAIDAKGTEDWLFENRHKIGEVMNVNAIEGRSQRSNF